MPEPSLSESKKALPSLNPRYGGLLIALVLGWFLFSFARWTWNDYWLLKDSNKGTAIVTHALWSGHDAVAYRYRVNGKEYNGESGRNHDDPRYMRVEAGEESVVYYSASHPWLSSLQRPETVGQGWPVILFVLVFEVLAIITVIKPHSKWAFNLWT